MATLADLLSTPSELEYGGRTYLLGPPDLLAQGRFQEWLIRTAREGVEAEKQYMGAEWADQEHTKITQARAARVYAWGGPVCMKALQTPEGGRKLMYFLLKKYQPDVTEELAGEIHTARAKWAEEVILREVERDPKAVAAFLKSQGMPLTILLKAGLPKSIWSKHSSGRANRRKKSRG